MFSISFSLFSFKHPQTHKKNARKQLNKQIKVVFREKKHDWTLDTCLFCCHLVTREKQVWEVEEKRALGRQGGGRLGEGDPAGVISWPWRPWLNFAVGWPVSQIPFLPLRHKDTISYLLASESVRETKKVSLFDKHCGDWQYIYNNIGKRDEVNKKTKNKYW